ncbi:cohesin domain-containing protein [Ruminococcus sp.]|uniref:cohesin domain-containing protein n=1 Tax=Ruminococcus sp. TaxID=41978 RepID=UPI0025F08459|nr:cohesin domain-containing protein [Ruminococcus sp.]MCR4639704.1 hypothetical protein [Ruminococcus sp.]
MKHKFAAAVMAAVMTAAGLTGCMEKKQPASSKKSTETAVTNSAAENDTMPKGEFVSESLELVKLKYADVPDLESGPELSISDTDAKPGEIAKVTVSVKGAADKWSMCGIHVTYPEELECQITDEKQYNAKYELGSAVYGNSGFVAMDWRENLMEELVREHQRAFFFTTMFMDSHGKDGDIATFFLKIPEDAQVGTVYNLGFFYTDSDMFRDLEGNLAFEKYAFTHMKGGTITVR